MATHGNLDKVSEEVVETPQSRRLLLRRVGMFAITAPLALAVLQACGGEEATPTAEPEVVVEETEEPTEEAEETEEPDEESTPAGAASPVGEASPVGAASPVAATPIADATPVAGASPVAMASPVTAATPVGSPSAEDATPVG